MSRTYRLMIAAVAVPLLIFLSPIVYAALSTSGYYESGDACAATKSLSKSKGMVTSHSLRDMNVRHHACGYYVKMVLNGMP